MKKILLLMSALGTLNAFASLPSELSAIKCRFDIEKVVKAAGSKDKWFRTIDPASNVMSFRSPTSEIGRWIEVQSHPDPYVFVFDNKKTKVKQFSGHNCTPLNVSDVRPLKIADIKGDKLTDKDIQKHAESKKKFLYYTWSPSMTYSVKEMHVFKKVAAKLGMEFVPVLDPFESMKNAQKVIKDFNLDIKARKIGSIELYMREGMNHYPSSFVMIDGKISRLLFGVMDEVTLEQRILTQLSNLAKEI